MEKMKLAAIINAWADCNDLLMGCTESAAKWADDVIVIWSTESNYGELTTEAPRCAHGLVGPYWQPGKLLSQRDNETAKRNYGLQLARDRGCTHFVTMDADEFYDSASVDRSKKFFEQYPDLNGLAVPCQTYFAKPWLTIGLDTTLVPFIHKLNPDTRHEFNRKYPFAWIDGKIRIDPTRSLNYISGIIHTESVIMHHYSWIRSDYKLKIRNSTARANIERSTILTDLGNAKEGYFCQFYGKTLVRTDVDFGIPDLSARDVT
jgi:hypothetical protein